MVKRVIPWALPSISGGSAGGYTPRPGPGPIPTDPYDFNDMQFELNVPLTEQLASSGGWSKTYLNKPEVVTQHTLHPSVTISGIKINDSSDVGSVIAYVEVAANDWSITGTSTTGTKKDLSLEFDITSVCSSIGGIANLNGKYETGLQNNQTQKKNVTWAVTNYTLTMVKVYNVNGAVIQEWQPSEESE